MQAQLVVDFCASTLTMEDGSEREEIDTTRQAGQGDYQHEDISEYHVEDRRLERKSSRKRRVVARREELLSGLNPDEKRDVASFMGSSDTKGRKLLQDAVRLIANSGRDPHLHVKKVLVHSLAQLDIDCCTEFLEAMSRLGQEATLQFLSLYERYNVPNAGGGMTECQADHFGRNRGVGKLAELLALASEDQIRLARTLAGWDVAKKVKVLRAWEATDPPMTATSLVGLVREEQDRGGVEVGCLWHCSLCPVKREVDIHERMKGGEHCGRGRSVEAALLYDYHPRSRRGMVLFRSPQESLFDIDIVRRTAIPGSCATEDVIPDEGTGLFEGRSELRITYAHRTFDPRRLCDTCTEELRAAIITHGHNLELWHTVDHERRALLTDQRQGDLWKARWLEREQQDRQVGEVLRLICEANLDSLSRTTLERRTQAAKDAQAAEVRRLLDVKLSNQAAVRDGAPKDELLKSLNVREAGANAQLRRLKACLDMERNYASLEPGGIPPSSRRRHETSWHLSDFLDDGTPATPQGAMQAFGRAAPPQHDEIPAIRSWKAEAQGTEVRLELRKEVWEWQSRCSKKARFSYLCRRWLGAAAEIEERQRQRGMSKALERERRAWDRQAAKLKRKEQLALLRADASCRATGEEKRREERVREAEARRQREKQELGLMRIEEARQLSAGDRYWGLIKEIHRLRAIEEERRLAWEQRVRATRRKMVAVRCISELSSFSHAEPPRDHKLAERIALLISM